MLLRFVPSVLVLLFTVSAGQSVRGPYDQAQAGRVFRMALRPDARMPAYRWPSSPGKPGEIPLGYLPDLMDQACKEMGMKLEIIPDPMEFTVFARIGRPVDENGLTGIPTLTDALMYPAFPNGQTWIEMFNMTATPVTIQRDTFGVLLRQVKVEGSMWRLFSPFSLALWMTMIGTIFAMSFVMMLINLLSAGEEGGGETWAYHTEQYFKVLYHAWAAILSGEDYEWVNWPGRIFRLGVLFFVIVSTATYTANLAAFFTTPQYRIDGPQDMTALQAARVLVEDNQVVQVTAFVQGVTPVFSYAPTTESTGFFQGYWVDGAAETQLPCVKGTMLPAAEPGLAKHDIDCILQVGVELVRSGKYTAFAAPHKALRYYTRQQRELCNEVVIPEAVSFGRHDMHLMLHRDDAFLSHQLSVTLDVLATKPSSQQLEQRWFSTGVLCSGSVSPTEEITLESQLGLFIVLGAFGVLSILSALVMRWSRLRVQRGDGHTASSDRVNGPEHDHALNMTDGEMLRLLLEKVNLLTPNPAAESGGKTVVTRSDAVLPFESSLDLKAGT